MPRNPNPREFATLDQILASAYASKGMNRDLDQFVRDCLMYDAVRVDKIREWANNQLARDDRTWFDRDLHTGDCGVICSFLESILHKTYNYRGYTYNRPYDVHTMTWYDAHDARIVANYDRQYI